MAAESAQDTVPSASGTEAAAVPLENGVEVADQPNALKEGVQKLSAAEKRRQRKNKNKQSKQLER